MVDGSTVIRAFLINLDRWVSEGIEPPPSAFPCLADGSAVPREAVLLDSDCAWPDAAGSCGAAAPAARSRRYARMYRTSRQSTPTATRWLAFACPTSACRWRRIRLGAAPPGHGRRRPAARHDGHDAPFAATDREREERADPRPSIEARYRDRDDYVARARAAAERWPRTLHPGRGHRPGRPASRAALYDLFAKQPAGAQR